MGKLSEMLLCLVNRFRKEKSVLEKVLLKNSEAKSIAERFLQSLESEFVDESLFLLLSLFCLVFKVDKNFRKNIENFNGRYLFNSRDKKVEVGVVFKNGKMKVESSGISKADVVVTFNDVPSLMKFVLSKDPNILNAVLNQTIVIDGNLNYIYKFGYMAQHLVVEIKKWFS